MYKNGLSILVAFGFIFLLGCQDKRVKDVIQTPTPEGKKEIKKIQFIPPQDSIITSDQLKNWITCNTLLDSLATMYADSFKTPNPQTRLRYQEDYSAAQDKICALSGLNGGYKEYQWIINNIGNPKNRSAVEAANISVY